MRISDWSSDVCSSDLRQAADRIRGGDPLNGLIVQVFSEVLRRAHPRDQLASACVVQVLVQRLHRDTLTNLARVEAIPAATDDPCVGCILGVRRGPGDKLFPAVSRSGVVAGHHRSEEHTSELQSLMRISYAVFCLKK